MSSTTSTDPSESYPDGGLLSEVRCAAFSAGMQAESCDKSGTQLCSKCRLIKYCSVPCQSKHWSQHKRDCKNAVLSPDWRPSWTIEGAPGAAFALGAAIDGDPTHCTWPPYPAYDCLKIAENEGPAAVEQGFNVCFAVDGGLSNLVVTVNALPSDYRGTFQALINNVKPVTSARDVVVLYFLLDPAFDADAAAELCTHLIYSAALTPAQSEAMHLRLPSLFTAANGPETSRQDFYDGRLRVQDQALRPLVDLLQSTYTLEDAKKKMYDVTHWNGHVHHLEKYVWSLKPAHRLSEVKLRKTGILLPFGESTSAYTEPNRLLFSKDGNWINASAIRPFVGWDMRDVLPSGAKHGCHEEDLSGCLFFYVKEQLALFARRAREWGVRVHLTHLLVNELAEHVAREDPELAPFRPGCFDRVDLPGLIDQLQDSVHLVFDYCGPFLRRGNPHAALLVRMFRWHGRRLGARAWSAGIETSGHVLDTEPVEKFRREAAAYLDFDISDRSRAAEGFLLIHYFEAFHDNEAAFQGYLTDLHLEEILQQRGLKLRTRHTITPSRLDWPLSGRPERLPGLSKQDWYLLACVGRHEFLDRVIEIGVTP